MDAMAGRVNCRYQGVKTGLSFEDRACYASLATFRSA